MPKKTKSIKKKTNIKKNKYLFLILIIVLLLIISLICLYRNDKKSFSQPIQSNNPEAKITGAWEQPVIQIPVSKNATSLFEISTESEDKKTIWNFIKNNYELQNNVNKNGESFVPFIIKDYKSKFKVNLTGLDITSTDIKNGSKRLNTAKQIEDLIISLGYKQIKIGDKTDSFEIVDTYENMNRTIFLKGDQIFSVYYTQGNFEEGDYGGCYIRVSYFNNIEKQISSQLNILNKLTNNSEGIIGGLLNGNYIDLPYFGKKINDYIIFYISNDSDIFLVLAKKNKDDFYEIIIEQTYDGKVFDYESLNIPKDVLCTYFNMIDYGQPTKDLSIIEKCK